MSGAAARIRPNPAQVVVSVLVAVLLALATWSADLAAGDWRSAARDETKASATTNETVRYVYADEAPVALGLTLALIRADELDRAAAAYPGGPATVEVATIRKAAAERSNALKTAADPGLLGKRYELPDHAFAINRRLGDLLADSADLRAHPGVAMAAGDRLARVSRVLLVVPILLVGGFVGVRALGYRRQPGSGRRVGEEDVGLIPQPWSEPSPVRVVSSTALVAWVLLTVLTSTQLALSSAAARADATSARLATSVAATILASGMRSGLEDDAVRAGIDLSMSGLARQFVTVSPADERQEAIGIADVRAATTWNEVAAGMIAEPSAADGLDAISLSMIGSATSDWNRLVADQNHAAGTAATQSSAATLASLGLLLAALSATTASAAKVQQRPRRPVVWAALAFLTAAVVAGVGALVLAA
jgi:hypothetical protein